MLKSTITLFKIYMQKTNIFLILLIVSLISLVILMVIGLYVLASPYPSSWFNDMWGHMGGMMGSSTVPAQNPALPYFTVLFVVLVGVAVVGAVGLVYFYVVPQIQTAEQATTSQKPPVAQNGASAYEAIVKTLTDEERSVIQVLKAHNGKYLQKYISKEAGLSRLKTHRILARLADRGIVSLKKFGNTNEAQLSDWLRS
jgi:biotin transporter BioY